MKVLLIMAFPIAAGTTLLADWIIDLMAGQSYLPESASALQILIWYLPLSFANGLLQYVLIAVNRQRTLTVAFAIGLLFNLAANLALIPIWGYLGAAVVTVASEAVLLVPFFWVAGGRSARLTCLASPGGRRWPRWRWPWRSGSRAAGIRCWPFPLGP